jgi:hypothetical protein
MTTTHTWPTREKWEAEQRRYAESVIEVGDDYWNELDCPQWSDDERTEIEHLAPVVIAMIRRTVGRIERQLRREHPQAGILARGITERPITMEAIDRHRAAIDALAGDERKAFWTLDRLGDVRTRLHHQRAVYHGNPDLFECPTERPWEFERIWPDGHDAPASPELDRLREMNTAAVERWHEGNRAMARRWLDDLSSGAAWQHELERRAQVEEYLRNGPVIHVIRPASAS